MFQEPKMQSMAGQMTNVMNNLMLPYNDALAAAVEAYFKSSNPTLYSTGKLWINSCNSCDENLFCNTRFQQRQNSCLFWSHVKTLDARVLQELQLPWMLLHEAFTIQVVLIDDKTLFYATTQEIWLRVANVTLWTRRTNASRAQDRLCSDLAEVTLFCVDVSAHSRVRTTKYHVST